VGERAGEWIDLSEAEVVDDHCHGFRLDDVVRGDPGGFEARLTLAGMCLMSSAEVDPGAMTRAQELVESTVFSLVARRWLAERLGCGPTAAAVSDARSAALRADPVGYVRALLDEERITGLVTDEGFPLPRIPSADFEADVGGVPVHRVVRIEPLIAELREGARSYADLEERFETELEHAAGDPRTVAYKSIIAYRTGLDVERVDLTAASAAFERWRAAGWPEARDPAKLVRDRLLGRTLAVAKRRGLVTHIHCGDGDPDISLAHARPHDLFPFLRDHGNQPIVLIHGGHPWTQVAAYIASLLPNVYIDLSVLMPWASSATEPLLEVLLGMVPTEKLLYASDQASEPEVFWLSARLARRALERVLTGLVGRDYLTAPQAGRIGRGILAGNSRRLHGIGR
jgi:predicted TIM-barrel fold metal-dependent hydrolase